MTKTEAINHAIIVSAFGKVAFVREDKGFFFVNDSRVTEKGVKWHGTAKLGKYHTKASIRAKANRKAREDALRSCGLVKVRGALGGVYWE